MRTFALSFLLLLCGITAHAQTAPPTTHSFYGELPSVFFFAIPVPTGIGVGYERWLDTSAQGFGLSGGLVTYPGLDGNRIHLPIRVAYILGSSRHMFQPEVGLAPGYEWLRVEDGSDLFRQRKFALTPEVNLNYRFQARSDGFFLKAGVHLWTPPIGEAIVLNEFTGDGTFDGPVIRPLFVAQVGWSFNYLPWTEE